MRHKVKCHECGTTRWGLVRQRRALKAFCSIRCANAHDTRLRKAIGESRRNFLAFLARGDCAGAQGPSDRVGHEPAPKRVQRRG